MINNKQCRAARGLLGWSIDVISEKSGLNRRAISQFENGHVSPHASTLQKIQEAFEAQGVVFGLNSRVELQSDLRVFKGRAGLNAFFAYVWEDVRANNGGQLAQIGTDEEYLTRWTSHAEDVHSKRMISMGGKIDFKVILLEGDADFRYDEYVTYRWLPKTQFKPLPFYYFNDNLAIIVTTQAEPIVYLHRDPDIAEAFRQHFLLLWDQAITPPPYQNK